MTLYEFQEMVVTHRAKQSFVRLLGNTKTESEVVLRYFMDTVDNKRYKLAYILENAEEDNDRKVIKTVSEVSEGAYKKAWHEYVNDCVIARLDKETMLNRANIIGRYARQGPKKWSEFYRLQAYTIRFMLKDKRITKDNIKKLLRDIDTADAE